MELDSNQVFTIQAFTGNKAKFLSFKQRSIRIHLFFDTVLRQEALFAATFIAKYLSTGTTVMLTCYNPKSCSTSTMKNELYEITNTLHITYNIALKKRLSKLKQFQDY